MISGVLSLSLVAAASYLQQYDADYIEGQQVADEIISAYADHPAGPEVMDYFTCYALYMEPDNVLFSPSARDMVFPSSHEIWDIHRSSFTYRHDGRSDRFWNIVRAHVNGAVLTRFADVGVQGCQDVLARYELPRAEHYARQNARREG